MKYNQSPDPLAPRYLFILNVVQGIPNLQAMELAGEEPIAFYDGIVDKGARLVVFSVAD